ncbi:MULTISPECIES: NifB/NifX family molybdenum-iron cluster-binding protein [Thiorhodovibrio]|jgi:predicted Fe-Mo cluster-binding NifX family protein|uniref:NifB/NifX family molybdenum-iron cluster-binding protein n=1 Tax=Thiorhodovibrio TaxID=61593 RepID=UPI001912B18A|nr:MULTISPECIES: NifB/NifX family molybdenum-iron cluster-binding protein [Thiorhodovibrio]MBK5968023.1 nitrogen fixation protein [Thiorhodovibrio winogradskyi]WPL11840.1 Dinitrogenase iron-molybdenum cofactor [Thiorhodovibrio litoralis]
MRVAVSSQNFRTITGHAGKSRRFILFDIDTDGQITERERLDLPKGMSLHDTRGPEHPLFEQGLTHLITGGAGERFGERMAANGITVIQTSEPEIEPALKALAAGEPLPPAAPHEH